MKQIYSSCLALLFGLFACTEQKASEGLGASQLHCPEIQGAASLLGQDGLELIVFGELHGMNEAPQFVGDMLCHDIVQNGNTVLALGYSKNMRADIDTYLAEPDEIKALTAILSTDNWSAGLQDGRTSQAMFGLITIVKQLQAKGYDAELALFISENNGVARDPNVSRSVYAQRHEKDMADNLIKIVKANISNGKRGHVIALVGNVHARRGMGKFTNPPYDLMAKFLPEKSTLTINNNYTAGTSWNCVGNSETNEIDCGVHENGSYLADVFKTNGLPNMERALHSFGENKKGYDGYYFIGKSTASLPAMELLREKQ